MESKEMRIALAVIAGPDAIEDGIERMLESAAGLVHGVYIGCTFTEDGIDPRVEVIFNMLDQEVFPEGAVAPIGWNDDFSAARNASFALVDRAMESGVDYDYIIWLDCDDVLPENVDLQAVCEKMQAKRAHGAFIEYEYTYDDANEMALMTHFKERIFRADINWNWIYPIHENCVGPMGVRMIKIEPALATVRHLRGEPTTKRKRNNKLVAKWFKECGKEEPRAVMFMAHETYAMAEESKKAEEQRALLVAALKLYKQFIATTPPDDDSYACNRQVADILVRLGHFEDAINIDLQGVKMEPEWPASYVGIAMAYHAMGDHESALKWAKNARLVQQDQETLGAHIVLEDQYKPLMLMGDCFQKLDDHEKAYYCISQAAAIYTDEWTEEKLREAKALRREARDLKLHQPLTLNRDRFWGTRSEKSIAFFVPPSIEDWNPDKLTLEGLGGTETSVIKLAERLAHLGWRVVIFGQPGSDWEDAYDDSYPGRGRVEWYRAGQWHPDEHFTAFVGLRSPEIFDSPISADVKILWLHDVSMGPARHGDYGDRFSAADIIACVSRFHMKHIVRTYEADGGPWTAENKVMANGFDVDKFRPLPEEEGKRDPKRIIYASSPDRGLNRLLDLWPYIAARVPDASLHVYYGWDSIDAIIERDLPSAAQLAYFKERTRAKFDQLVQDGYNLVWHGRISESRLARHMQKSGVIAYPANFMETFGIVFAQAMAAGVIPVVPDLGNLPALVRDNGIIVPGAPDSMEFGMRFVEAVVAATKPPSDQRQKAADAVTQFDWELIAETWDQLITNRLVKVLAA